MHEPQPDYGFSQAPYENGYSNQWYQYEDVNYQHKEPARLPVKQPPHHYVPISPPKPHLLPVFDQERRVNADSHKPTTAEHIRQVGVPVLPIGQPGQVGVDKYGIVPPSQNKAYLQHLRNHRNFDTMKNLQSVNDCQICQMFLAAEGYQLHRPPGSEQRPKLNSLQIDIPEEPMEYSLDPNPRDNQYPVYPTPYPNGQPVIQMPSPQRPQVFDGLVDARHRQRMHVRDIFQNPMTLAPPNYSDPMPNGYSPRLQQHKIIIPAPDYEPPVPDYPISARPPIREEFREPVKLSGGSNSSKSSIPQTSPPIVVQKPPEKLIEVNEARILKDYQKRGEGDLTVHKNDVVEVLESNGRWCRVRTIEGLVGFLPQKYLHNLNK